MPLQFSEFGETSLQFVYDTICFTEKISRNTVLADLFLEKNTVPAEKTSWKRRIIREANGKHLTSLFCNYT